MDGMPPPDEEDGRPLSMDDQAGAALVASRLAVLPDGLAVLPADGLAAPEGLVALVVEAHTDAMSNALALARTLLPTAPPPALQYNLPAVDVQR